MPLPPSNLPTGTRKSIIDLLRQSALTANEIAAALGLTHNAVRAHLTGLQRDGLIREGGLRRGETRPSMLYELVPRADSVFSRAYIPFIAQLLKVLGERMSKPELDELMRTVGTSLAAEWPRLNGDLGERVRAAAVLLQELGAMTEVEPNNGGFVLRGYGCILGEAVHGRPEVCRAVESLVAQLVQAEARECCQHGEHPRCCFEISPIAKTSRIRGQDG
jgi:predicted ArsR family transcriptional regulator